MRSSTRFALVLILVVVATLAYRSYRVRAAAEEAFQYAPAAAVPKLLPAGTAIQVVVWGNGIPESASAGDEVTAFLTSPIVVEGKSLIASGGQVKGTVKQVEFNGSKARARIDFTDLILDNEAFNIQAQPVDIRAPVESDLEIIGGALSTLMGASLGASIGAASGDEHLVDQGFVEGAITTMPDVVGIPLQVILVRDVSV